MGSVKSQKGFSLVELLVSVVVIGILVSISVPQFGNYRVKSHNTTAHSDLRNLQLTMEAAYADQRCYPTIP